MPVSDKDWRAKPVLPKVQQLDNPASTDANPPPGTWNGFRRVGAEIHPQHYGSAHFLGSSGNSTGISNNSSPPASPMRSKANNVGPGMFTDYASYDSLMELENFRKLVGYSGNTTNLRGLGPPPPFPTYNSRSTNRLDGNGSNITAGLTSPRSVTPATLLRGIAHLSQEALDHRAQQANGIVGPTMRPPPGFDGLVLQDNSTRKGVGEGNSIINAGPSGSPSSTLSNSSTRGHYPAFGTFNVNSHPLSSQERPETDPFEYKSRMTVVYGQREPLKGEFPKTEEATIKCFLAPFEATGFKNLFAKRILINWICPQKKAMAETVVESAKRFCRKEKDRQLIIAGRVLSLRDFLEKGGLCVEPRIGMAFIVEGCRVIASCVDHGKPTYRTVEKLQSCLTLMLQTVIVAHPRNAQDRVPICTLPGVISMTRSAFIDPGRTDDSKIEHRLPGGNGVYTDAKGVEHPSGAVLVGENYCTTDGCITCGIVHPPSYFEKAYPKLAKAIARERSEFDAKISKMRESHRLTKPLVDRRLSSIKDAQETSEHVNPVSSCTRPSSKRQVWEPYRCDCGKTFYSRRALENCRTTVHGKYRY